MPDYLEIKNIKPTKIPNLIEYILLSEPASARRKSIIVRRYHFDLLQRQLGCIL